MTKRKELELNIINSLDNKDLLEQALVEAWSSNLFSKEEMDIIVRDSEVYQTKNTNKIEATTQMIKKLGLSKAFVLTNIIQQAPTRTKKDGYIQLDKKSILRNVRINEYQFIVVMNELANEGYIKKDRKGCILLWEAIERLYTI